MIDLSPDTKVKLTIGAVVVGFIAAATFGWKAQATLSVISVNLKETNDRMAIIEKSMNDRLTGFETVMSDRWTKSQAAEWALRFVVNNPSLHIPDPRDPGHFLNDGIRGTGKNLGGDSNLYLGALP